MKDLENENSLLPRSERLFWLYIGNLILNPFILYITTKYLPKKYVLKVFNEYFFNQILSGLIIWMPIVIVSYIYVIVSSNKKQKQYDQNVSKRLNENSNE